MTRQPRNLRIPPGKVAVFAASEASLMCFFADPEASHVGLIEVSFEAVSFSEQDFAMGLRVACQALGG